MFSASARNRAAFADGPALMNCDRIARWYRWLELAAFGHALDRRRRAFLGELHDARRVLVLGDGDGRALSALLDAAPKATADYVDSSARMLDLARARNGTGRVTYYHADALTCAFPTGEYDAIATHFFLDCMNDDQAASLIARTAAAARPEARWVISEFQQTSWWTSALVRGLYACFRIATSLETRRIPQYRAILARRGFRLVRVESAWGGLLVSELWARGAAAAHSPPAERDRGPAPLPLRENGSRRRL